MKTDYEKLIRERLKPKRAEHSIRVAETAVLLAKQFGADPDKAYTAGLLHDYAKAVSENDLLVIAKKESLIRDVCEYMAPHLLHGPVGAWLLRTDGIIADEEVLQAVASHTIGHANMTLLEKIIFVADYIEPGRKTPGVEKVRKISYDNLDAGIVACLDGTISWLLQSNAVIHPDAIRLRNELLPQVRKGVHE